MDQSAQDNACIAYRVSREAAARPDAIAVAEAIPRGHGRMPEYRTLTFAQLDAHAQQIANGLVAWGIRPGMRLVLLVPFSGQFIALVLGLLKSGATVVMVDPGMGRSKILQCLAELQPSGFVTIPKVQFLRSLMRRKFPQAIWNVTVGPRFGWPGMTLNGLVKLAKANPMLTLPHLRDIDEAAVIFTTGSTGPPKGVLYNHGIFSHQVTLIQQQYGIQAGDRDLACFPLFGLFDTVMGVTTVIPEMDPTRPADVDPPKLFHAIDRWQTNQAFGSPALWTKVVRYCEQTGSKIPHLQRVLSAGAPVPPYVLRGLRSSLQNDADIFTPYGATESLPIASIESREIINDTVQETIKGAGTCVGRLFPSMQWRVISISDKPLATIEDAKEVPQGTIGELMVAGPVVTERYVTRVDQNAFHKVADGDRYWHRVGDVGYLDAGGRFWFCGRKSHRVETSGGMLFTELCEAIVNTHPQVYRSALVGIGQRPLQRAFIVVEPWAEQRPSTDSETRSLVAEINQRLAAHDWASLIEDVLIYPTSLPVDIRHNSKIFREQLVAWVERKTIPTP